MKHFYGWRIVYTLAITNILSYGILCYTFSVFVEPMEHELGWSRAQTSLGASIALLVSGMVAPLLGKWVDRHGARLLMTAGSIFGTLLMFLWANVHNLYLYYLLWALMGLAWGAVLYEVTFTVVSQWFKKNRSKAFLTITLIAGLASTVFIPTATWLRDTLGWREALQVLGVILGLGTILPHFLVVRRRPEDLGLTVDGFPEDASPSTQPAPTLDGKTALKSPVFWWLTVGFTLLACNVVALGAHMVPLLTERGFSSGMVAAAAGGLGLMALPGRAIFAPLSNKVPTMTLTIVTIFLQGLALLALLNVPGLVGLWTFVVLLGMSNGAATLARASVIAELFDSKSYGVINGTMVAMSSWPKALFPVFIGVLYSVWHGYVPVLWLMTGLSLLACLTVWWAQKSKNQLAALAAGD